MNAIDSRQQFEYEFIAGVSLSNDFRRLNRNNSNIDTKKERHVLQNKFNNKQNQITSILLNEQSEKKQLEIIGLEFGPKTPNRQLLIKDTNSSISQRFKLSRVDQTTLHLPKRTTIIAGRKVQENALRRTWTSHVPFSSHLTTPDKLTIASPNRRANTSTQSSDDRSTMVQRMQTNLTLDSPMTIFKKTPTTNNQMSPRLLKKPQQPTVPLARETTSIKVPTLVKRAPSLTIKPIPSAYIQDSSRPHVPPSTNLNRPVLQPTPVLPIYTPRRSVTLFTGQQHLPSIKDRMIKANLAQKASFKCKSPLPYRPDSSVSRSTAGVITASRLQMKIYNPLKQMDVSLLLNEAARNRLKRLFHQLDTDRDGHLTYPQVQKCLPPNLPRAQETFFRVLYDITSDITYFGLEEFYATAILVDLIAEQDSYIWNTLLDDVDFNYYRDDLLELLEEFDTRCSPITSTIHFDNLIALIMNRTTNGRYEHITKELEKLIPMIKTMKFTRLEFIVLIPVIIYLESCLDHGKSLFRFRENSILDLHMQKALLI